MPIFFCIRTFTILLKNCKTTNELIDISKVIQLVFPIFLKNSMYICIDKLNLKINQINHLNAIKIYLDNFKWTVIIPHFNTKK